jgi:hypothetical protein
MFRLTNDALPAVATVRVEVRDPEVRLGRSLRSNMRRPPAVSVRHLTVVAVVVVLAMLVSSTASWAQQAPVGLGTADEFAVLAGETITNTGPTTITGDVGLHPGSSVTGFSDVTLNGSLHLADAVAEQAKVDLVTAYNDAAGRTPSTTVATELGGQILPGGVYNSASGTFEITGQLTLDAQGDPGTVWVFQTASTLITASASSVNLINGADACNVFWQVGSSATLGTSSSFTGTIMALASSTLNTGATVQGRVLARNGAVTLDTNTITRSVCATPPPTPTPTPTATATPTPTTTPTPTPGDTAIPPGDTATPPGDTATPPGPIQPPTRIDTGGGGTAPTASGLLLMLLAVVVVAGAAVTLRRR